MQQLKAAEQVQDCEHLSGWHRACLGGRQETGRGAGVRSLARLRSLELASEVQAGGGIDLAKEHRWGGNSPCSEGAPWVREALVRWFIKVFIKLYEVLYYSELFWLKW